MSHQPYVEWIQASLDGDLQSEQRLQLEEHLLDCAACQSIRDALLEVERLFRAEPAAAPRPGFTGRFSARLAQHRARPRLVWGALALGLGSVGAAAMVLPLGIGLILSSLRVVQQPAATAGLFSGLTTSAVFVGTLLEALFTLVRVLGEWALANPWAWAGGLAVLALPAVWLYAVRKLTPEVSFR